MNWQNNKFEISVMTGLALTLAGLFSLFQPMKSYKNTDKFDIGYEMARPNSFTPGEYDLSDREIDRKYINPFEKVETPAKPNANKKATNNTKKNQTKKAQAKSSQDKKKPTTSITLVDGRKRSLTDSDNNTEMTTTNNAPIVAQQNKNNDDKKDKQDKDANKRSPDQWRALLLADPSYENMKALMQAYSEKQIDQASYYRIIQSLLENQNAQTQNVGLYGAQGFPSVESFTVIVKHEDVLGVGNANGPKKFAEQILLGYNQAQNIGILGQVLRSNDEEVVLKAGDVIITGIQKYRNGESINEGNRSNRGDVRIRSASQYSVLIPVLQQLASTPNSNIAQLASSVLSQIQSLMAASNNNPPPTT